MCNNYEYALCRVIREFSEPRTIEEVWDEIGVGEAALLKMYLGNRPVVSFMHGLVQYGYLEDDHGDDVYHLSAKGQEALNVYGKCLESATA